MKRLIRWSEGGSGLPLSKGDTVVAEGTIRYGQDFSWWEGDFPDTVWSVHDVWDDGRVVLESYGYGLQHTEPYDPKAYGSGKIYVSARCVKQLRRA